LWTISKSLYVEHVVEGAAKSRCGSGSFLRLRLRKSDYFGSITVQFKIYRRQKLKSLALLLFVVGVPPLPSANPLTAAARRQPAQNPVNYTIQQQQQQWASQQQSAATTAAISNFLLLQQQSAQ
jgi:hypothetical protein